MIERLELFTPTVRAAGLAVVLSRPEWTRQFLDHVEGGTARVADLSLEQKQALANHPDASLRRRAWRRSSAAAACRTPTGRR